MSAAVRAVRSAAGSGTAPVRLVGVSRTYHSGTDAQVRALDGVDIAFPAGSFTAVMGPSGSGKSTLLQCAAGLDRVDAGAVFLAGHDLTGLDETRLTEISREHAAFVFQSYNLMPALTARQNVILPLRLAGKPVDERWVDEVLDRVGLAQRAHHRPAQLSGGQQQRVAIARAAAARPAVTFADEPTGALDTRAAAEVLDLLRDMVDGGHCVVMVTHDPTAAARADAVVFLVDGMLAARLDTPSSTDVAGTLDTLGAPR